MKGRWVVAGIALGLAVVAGVGWLAWLRLLPPARSVAIREMKAPKHEALFQELAGSLSDTVRSDLPATTGRMFASPEAYRQHLRFTQDISFDYMVFRYSYWSVRKMLMELPDPAFRAQVGSGMIWKSMGGGFSNEKEDRELLNRAKAALLDEIAGKKELSTDAALNLLEFVSGMEYGALFSMDEFQVVMAAILKRAEALAKTCRGYADGASLALMAAHLPDQSKSDEWLRVGLRAMEEGWAGATLEEQRRGVVKLVAAARLLQGRPQNETKKRLFGMCERQAEWLMFLSEADGCLPQIDGVKRRYCIRHMMHRASLAFDRDDFRFAAFGGSKMADAYPPRRTDLLDPEGGVYVFRNTWHMNRLMDREQGKVFGQFGYYAPPHEEAWEEPEDAERFGVGKTQPTPGRRPWRGGDDSEGMFTLTAIVRTGGLSISGELKPLCIVLREHGLGEVKVESHGRIHMLTSENASRRLVLDVDEETKKIEVDEEDTDGKDVRWELWLDRCDIRKEPAGFSTCHPPVIRRFPFLDDWDAVRERGNIRVTHNGRQRIVEITGVPQKPGWNLDERFKEDPIFQSDDDVREREGMFAKVSITGTGRLSATFEVLPFTEESAAGYPKINPVKFITVHSATNSSPAAKSK